MGAEGAEAALRLVALSVGDRDRVRGWLGEQSVGHWLGTAAQAEAELTVAFASPSAICRLIAYDGDAIGYAHALDSALLGTDDVPDAMVGDWACSVFIAARQHRGKGLGSIALRQLIDEVFSTTMASGCAIRVPVRSERAVRALEAMGLTWSAIEHVAPHGPMWLMHAERPRR